MKPLGWGVNGRAGSMTCSTPIDFRYLSPRNLDRPTRLVTVASGATFVALDLSPPELRSISNALYLHIHSSSRRCYVGVTVMEVSKRWLFGWGYRKHRRFGNAIRAHGWHSFESVILALAEDRKRLHEAEAIAIKAAGGHKSHLTYNLTPGGDIVAENDKPVVGVYLPTGDQQLFASSSQAARELGFSNSDMPNAVARKERMSVRDWWFRFVEDTDAQPPKEWGESLRHRRIKELRGRSVVAIHYETGESRTFQSTGEAAVSLGMSQSDVWAVASGGQHSAGGWWFHFEDDPRPMPPLKGSEATREKRDVAVYAVSLTTKEKRRFRNCTVADAELKLHVGAAASVASGRRASAGDWWFTFNADADRPELYGGKLVAKQRSKPIIVTDRQTGQESRFESAKEAQAIIGVHRSTISGILGGKRKAVVRYSFRFSDEEEE